MKRRSTTSKQVICRLVENAKVGDVRESAKLPGRFCRRLVGARSGRESKKENQTNAFHSMFPRDKGQPARRSCWASAGAIADLKLRRTPWACRRPPAPEKKPSRSTTAQTA